MSQRAAFLLSLGQADDCGAGLRGLPAAALARRWARMGEGARRRAAQRAADRAASMTYAELDALEEASQRELDAIEAAGGWRADEAHAAAVEVATTVDNRCSAAAVTAALAEAVGPDTHSARAPRWRRYLLRLLPRGGARLGRGLPPGAACWHKTGTLSGVINDAGVLAPPGAEDPVCAVCVLCQRVARGQEAEAAAVAADVARAALAAAA